MTVLNRFFCSRLLALLDKMGSRRWFQTHTVRVLLSHGKRAELTMNEYLPLTPVSEGFDLSRIRWLLNLEGVGILHKNPYFEKWYSVFIYFLRFPIKLFPFKLLQNAHILDLISSWLDVFFIKKKKTNTKKYY